MKNSCGYKVLPQKVEQVYFDFRRPNKKLNGRLNRKVCRHLSKIPYTDHTQTQSVFAQPVHFLKAYDMLEGTQGKVGGIVPKERVVSPENCLSHEDV